MLILRLDDLRMVGPMLPATDMLGPMDGAVAKERVDEWWEEWVRTYGQGRRSVADPDGIFIINAHARVSASAARQDLEGVEVLKHIRLTGRLDGMSAWHAIVFSFEPLDSILRRKPGDLILTSPGVTFLRLPEAMDLKASLLKAYPRRTSDWGQQSLEEIVADLAKRVKATPKDRSFISFVACDHVPVAAHSISNWWGVYQMLRAIAGSEYPEGDDAALLPDAVRRFVRRLDVKQARYLDDAFSREPQAVTGKGISAKSREAAAAAAEGKRVVYVDDEASNGWDAVLRTLVGDAPVGRGTANLLVADPMLLRLRPKGAWLAPSSDEVENYGRNVAKLAHWIVECRPDLVILDLRLLGRDEEGVSPNAASGMQVAREIRRLSPYLPVLLFTASNKAETVLISRALDVDDYWMKPGLGEHRSERGRDEDLWALSTKLQGLLGPRYAWLTRVGDEVQKIEVSTVRHWWEQDIEWPPQVLQSAGRTTETGAPEIVRASENARPEVVGRMRSIVHTMRLVFRLRQEQGTKEDVGRPPAVDAYQQPRELEYALRASVLIQVGQIVELVHRTELEDGVAASFRAPSKNARIGGWGKGREWCVFRRRDWWAFRLYALRNDAAHFDEWLQDARDEKLSEHELVGDRSLVNAVSDIVAWLTVPMTTVQSIEAVGAGRLAKKCGKPQVFRMHPFDPIGTLTSPDRTRVNMSGISGRDALSELFRQQIHLRGGYVRLSTESTRLLGAADSL